MLTLSIKCHTGHMSTIWWMIVWSFVPMQWRG